MVFEVTQDCNLACKYCTFGEHYTNHETRNHKRMEFETITIFIDYLLHLKEKHNRSHRSYFNIGFYGGEPLLNFVLIEKTVNYLSDLGVDNRRFGYSMTTNGLLLKEHIAFLVRHDFHISVSLDGDREGNDLRVLKNGDSSFDIVYKNIKFIQKCYPEYFKRNVSFITVSNQKNTLGESI